MSIKKIPLDLEGNLPSNYFVSEEHSVTTARNKVNRVIVPEHGAFFNDSVEVRDANGVVVTRREGLELTYHYELFSELTGKGVSALMIITDPARPSPFKITYRAVGGSFSLSVKELKDVIDFASNNTEKIKWDDIIDKPSAYVPSPHFNKYWQLYGLDSIVTNLRRFADAWAVGRKGMIEATTEYYQDYIKEIEAAVEAYTARVMAHITDRSNPHKTDKFKVNLGEINNWPLADYVTGVSLTDNERYQSMGGIYNQLVTNAVPVLNSHVTDYAVAGRPTPHNLTLAQLNIYSRAEIDEIFTHRLLTTSVAYNTNNLVGVDWVTFYNTLRSNLDVSNVARATRFNQNQLGEIPAGADPTQYALLGNGKYALYKDLMKTYNDTQGSIYYIGYYGSVAAAMAAADAMPGLSPGTYFVGSIPKGYHDLTLYGAALYKRDANNKTQFIMG
ncbi:virion structural protein [Pseudomonas phage Phabio]|uniref:Virion structural protein n=1 Tax=Pseudomonas phage Phabio TaxID=2006668 RepID=A0A1Y0T032_9CAUD|nr:virion structural protein [Pseudomonas phage Phabio]ARV76838.1 virion structural protein [Pseudomonas phage Phabio]